MKIVCLGLNRTGTSTLGRCLEEFGYRHIDHNLEMLKLYKKNEIEKILSFAEQFDSFDTWPWALMYKEFDQAFAGSKFILTHRKDPETWVGSLVKHSKKTGPTEFREIVYGHSMPDGYIDEHIKFYNRHNEQVRSYFKGRDQDYLEICWENGDSWDKLAGFLGHPVPDKELPHVSKSHSKTRLFLSNLKSRLFRK